MPAPSPPSAGGAKSAYVVYVLGVREYDQPEALFASVDFGHTFVQLSVRSKIHALSRTPTTV